MLLLFFQQFITWGVSYGYHPVTNFLQNRHSLDDQISSAAFRTFGHLRETEIETSCWVQSPFYVSFASSPLGAWALFQPGRGGKMDLSAGTILEFCWVKMAKNEW